MTLSVRASGRAQGGIPGSRPDITGLLLHGWHHPAQTPAARAARDRALLEGIRVAGSQCVPCRRWQPAPADPLRCQQPGELEQAEEVGGRILELCVEVGGTITGEHGVGLEKINQMCAQFPPEGPRCSMTSGGVRRPGSAQSRQGHPTLNRCAEFGAMHVKGRGPASRTWSASDAGPGQVFRNWRRRCEAAARKQPLRLVGLDKGVLRPPG